MRDLSEHILRILHKKELCNEWIQSNYKQKPMVIYGGNGCGKTNLAHYIFKNYTTIHIHSDNSRSITNLHTFLNDSFYKKSITMLFDTRKNNYKSLIIDDLEIIKQNNKQLFKSIISFSKKTNRENPVIYIINSLLDKDIRSLYENCYPIHIDIPHKELYMIVRNFFVTDKKHLSYIKHIVNKCHSNFHSIQSNLLFHTKKETILSYEKKEQDKILFYNQLMEQTDINQIIRMVSHDYTVISLNILENFIPLILQSSLCMEDKIKMIHKIYIYNCFSDYISQKYIVHSNTHFDEINIFLNTVVPVYSLQKIQPCLQTFQYTKTISKCIIYTHHRKLMDSISITYMDIFILFCMFYKKYPLSSIQTYIQRTQITKKVMFKFMKYYEGLYKYTIPKKIINKLF